MYTNSVILFTCLSVFITRHFSCNDRFYFMATDMEGMILLFCFLLKCVGDCLCYFMTNVT